MSTKPQVIIWSEKVSYTIMAGLYMFEEELEEKEKGRSPDSRRSMQSYTQTYSQL